MRIRPARSARSEANASSSSNAGRHGALHETSSGPGSVPRTVTVLVNVTRLAGLDARAQQEGGLATDPIGRIDDAARRLAGAGALVRDGQRDLDAVGGRDRADHGRREGPDAAQGQPGDDGQSDEGQQDRDHDRAVDLRGGRVLEPEWVALLAQADIERHRPAAADARMGLGGPGCGGRCGSRRGGGHPSMVPRMPRTHRTPFGMRLGHRPCAVRWLCGRARRNVEGHSGPRAATRPRGGDRCA